jgi:hypothetical protein
MSRFASSYESRGETWQEHYCPICGSANYCSCDADAEREQREDEIAAKYGRDFVVWLRDDFDVMEDDFSPAAAFLLFGGEVDEYEDGLAVLAVAEFAAEAKSPFRTRRTP